MSFSVFVKRSRRSKKEGTCLGSDRVAEDMSVWWKGHQIIMRAVAKGLLSCEHFEFRPLAMKPRRPNAIPVVWLSKRTGDKPSDHSETDFLARSRFPEHELLTNTLVWISLMIWKWLKNTKPSWYWSNRYEVLAFIQSFSNCIRFKTTIGSVFRSLLRRWRTLLAADGSPHGLRHLRGGRASIWFYGGRLSWRLSRL